MLSLVRSEDMHLKRLFCNSLYGLEACPLNKAGVNSLDFVINRFFKKLFKTNNIDIVRNCQKEFAFELPSVLLAHRSEHF